MWNKKRQFLAGKNKVGSMAYVESMRQPGAKEYARKLFELRTRGLGDKKPEALDDVAKWSGMSERSFERLMRGETKKPDESLRTRIRSAYLAYCEKLIGRLQHEIEIEKRKHGDEAFEDLGAEAAVLMEKVQAAKERAV
jgi:hypothetical protein